MGRKKDEKVIGLAQELNSYEDFKVIFDKWDLELGQELPRFMEDGVGESDFVLIICSERYKDNADKRQGGSGYEACLMANEIFKGNNNKFIPIILHEEDKDNIPKFLEGKVWIELYYEKNSKEYELRLDDLFASLISMTKRPTVDKRSVKERFENKNINRLKNFKNLESVKIIGIQTDGVTLPKMDGTPGSALYKVPFLLNKIPNKSWRELFIKNWNNPREFTTMHRPGIASIQRDKILLNGTTIEEVQSVHRKTLLLCVDDTNKELSKLIKRQEESALERERKKNDFQKNIQSIAKDIKF